MNCDRTVLAPAVRFRWVEESLNKRMPPLLPSRPILTLSWNDSVAQTRLVAASILRPWSCHRCPPYSCTVAVSPSRRRPAITSYPPKLSSGGMPPRPCPWTTRAGPPRK
eukprot:366253-Chlamydomonas_euryale.AAC.2